MTDEELLKHRQKRDLKFKEMIAEIKSSGFDEELIWSFLLTAYQMGEETAL